MVSASDLGPCSIPQHGDAVVSTVALQQESFRVSNMMDDGGFSVPSYMFSTCLRGFPPGNTVSFHGHGCERECE